MDISLYCKAPVKIGGDDEEGTHYYTCTKCDESCDLSHLENEIIKYIDEMYFNEQHNSQHNFYILHKHVWERLIDK